jgi:hypothetical protein
MSHFPFFVLIISYHLLSFADKGPHRALTPRSHPNRSLDSKKKKDNPTKY